MSEESIKMEDGGEHNLEPAMSMENLSDTGNPAMHLTTFQSQSFIGPIQIVFFIINIIRRPTKTSSTTQKTEQDASEKSPSIQRYILTHITIMCYYHIIINILNRDFVDKYPVMFVCNVTLCSWVPCKTILWRRTPTTRTTSCFAPIQTTKKRRAV